MLVYGVGPPLRGAAIPKGPPFSAISSGDNLQLGIRLGLGSVADLGFLTRGQQADKRGSGVVANLELGVWGRSPQRGPGALLGGSGWRSPPEAESFFVFGYPKGGAIFHLILNQGATGRQEGAVV